MSSFDKILGTKKSKKWYEMNYDGEIGDIKRDFTVGDLIHLRKKGLPSITKRQEKVLEEIKERFYNWDNEPEFSDIFSKELNKNKGITVQTLKGLEKKGFIHLSKDDYYFKKEGYIVYPTLLIYLWWIEKTGELPSWAEYELENPKDYYLSAEFEASQRKCGACGETGHNARTCKSKSVPFSTGGFWNEKTFDGLEQLGLPFVDAIHVAMISKIVDGEVLKEPNSNVRFPNITWKEEPITMTWGELDEKCKTQDLVSIGESTYSGSYLRSALAYLPKNTVLTLYTGRHWPLKATFEYGGEEWIFILAPRVEDYYAENLKDWSEQEMKSHGKDVSFKDFIKKEIKSHGNIDLVEWAKHEEKSHKERYGAENKSNTLDNKTHQKKYMAQDKNMTRMQVSIGCPSGSTRDFTKIFDVNVRGSDLPYLTSELEDVVKSRVASWNKDRYKRYAETFGADYSFTGKIKKYGFELSDGGKEYVITYGGRRIPSFRLPKDTYFHGVYTIERFVEELNQNQERAVSDVFNFLWNKTNNGHLDDILMNRAETFEARGNMNIQLQKRGDYHYNCPYCKKELTVISGGLHGESAVCENDGERCNGLTIPNKYLNNFDEYLWYHNTTPQERNRKDAESEESNFGSVGEGNNFGQMRAEGDGENCPRCNSESLGNRICSQCGHEWEIDVGQFNTESLIEEPDFIPDGDGRALGQQTSSINLSPLHAESKVLSKTNLVIAGVIGLGLWKGKQILDTAKSSLKQSAENKKKGCSTCNSNGTVRKNHTQVKQSEYSVNQINPVEAEGQNDIHGAEGVTNPRHAPSSQPFGYPSKSLKMW